MHIIEKPDLDLILDKYELKGGDSAPVVQHVYTITDDDVKEYATYSSTNENVISIDSSGVMTVNGIGTATITATYTSDGKTLTATKDVTVSYSDDFNVTSPLNMTENDNIPLANNPFGISPFIGDFTYTVTPTNDSPSDGLTISEQGVTASKAGTYTVTIKRHDAVNESDWTTKIVDVNVTTGAKPLTIMLRNKDDNQTLDTVQTTYTYDEEQGIITIILPKTGEQWRRWEFTSIKTIDELKSLVPQKYELVASGQVGYVGMSAAGFDWAQENTGSHDAGYVFAFNATNPTQLSNKDRSTVQIDNDAGPYTLKIYVKSTESGGGESGGGSSESGNETVIDKPFSDYSNGNVPITGVIEAGSKVTIKLKGTANKGYKINLGGNTSQAGGWQNLNGDDGYSGNLDANGEAIKEITVNQKLYYTEIQRWYDEGGNLMLYSYTITPPDTANANSANTAKFTRFNASGLRLGAAKLLAAKLGTSENSLQSAITPLEEQSFAEDGCIEKTVNASDNWQIAVSELPQYYIKSDGTVANYYYWAEEMSGADGYKASYSFKDNDDETDYSINASQSGDALIKIKNTLNQTHESVELPESGGSGTTLYYTISGILLMLSAVGYVTIKRRRWSDE